MNVGQLKLGNTQISNNVFLAPMAGYTDYAFRHLILEEGAGLVFTELVSAKGIIYKAPGTKDLLHTVDDGLTSAQIFGSDSICMKGTKEQSYLIFVRLYSTSTKQTL